MTVGEDERRVMNCESNHSSALVACCTLTASSNLGAMDLRYVRPDLRFAEADDETPNHGLLTEQLIVDLLLMGNKVERLSKQLGIALTSLHVMTFDDTVSVQRYGFLQPHEEHIRCCFDHSANDH